MSDKVDRQNPPFGQVAIAGGLVLSMTTAAVAPKTDRGIPQANSYPDDVLPVSCIAVRRDKAKPRLATKRECPI